MAKARVWTSTSREFTIVNALLNENVYNSRFIAFFIHFTIEFG